GLLAGISWEGRAAKIRIEKKHQAVLDEKAEGNEAKARDILARVETVFPKWTTAHSRPDDDTYPELESGKARSYSGSYLHGDYLEWVLNNTGPWCILMTCQQQTADGTLDTYVYSSPGAAVVSVAIQGTNLTSLSFHRPSGNRPGADF